MKDKKFKKSFLVFPESDGLLDQMISRFVRDLILDHAKKGVTSLAALARYWNKSRHAFKRMVDALGISENLRGKK